MDVTGFSKGLSNIGKFILQDRQSKRSSQNQIALEQLKNDLWMKGLRQKAEQERQLKEFILGRQQDQAEIESRRDAGTKREERLFKEREADKQRTNRLKVAGVKTGTSKSTADKQLEQMLNIYKISQPQRDDEGELIEGTGDPVLMRNVLSSIKDYGKKRLGIPEGTENDTVINYFNSLRKGGIDEKTAAIMSMRRFSTKSKTTTQESKSTKKTKNEGDVLGLGL